MKTSVFDWGKPSLIAIDRRWSAYANAVIPELVRIMITYVRQTEKQMLQMLLGQEAVGRLPLYESMVTNTLLF